MCVLDNAIQYWIAVFSAILSLLCAGTFCCRYEFNSKESRHGTFHSPDHKLVHPHANISCTYVFQGNSNDRIKIIFDVFNLDNGTEKGGCNVMYIDVFQIDTNGIMDLTKRICGSSLPEEIISVHFLVHLVFKMRPQSTKNFSNFRGTYDFVDESWQPFPDSSHECGPVLIEGVGGVITSPNFPQPYKTNLECTWMVKVEYWETIVLNIVEMDIDEEFHCNTKEKPYLSIWNGFAAPDTPVDKIVCGRKYFYDKAKLEFRSSTNRIVFRFETGPVNSENHTGFKLVWTAVTVPQLSNGLYDEELCPPPQYMCEGGDQCLEGVICNPLPRYCISDTLRCNGLSNCATGDDSDESGCWNNVIISLGTIGGLILTVLLTMALVSFYRKRRRRRQLSRAGHVDGVTYDPNDKIQAQYYKNKPNEHHRKGSIGFSPVKKLASPGYIAVYSPDKKGYSVYDEYDSEPCWNDSAVVDSNCYDYEKKDNHVGNGGGGGQTYINPNAHFHQHQQQHHHHPQNQHQHQHQQQMYQQGNQYETRESMMVLRASCCNHRDNAAVGGAMNYQSRSSPNVYEQTTSPRKRVVLQNSPSGSLMQMRNKSQYIACPTLPTPPESDPEVDPLYAGCGSSGTGGEPQTYMVVRDRVGMVQNMQKNPIYSTIPRINSKSVSAVV